jgi:hypothetical protein
MRWIVNWLSVAPVQVLDLQARDIPSAQYKETPLGVTIEVYEPLSGGVKGSSGRKCVDRG